jgi:hypothetical protein
VGGSSEEPYFDFSDVVVLVRGAVEGAEHGLDVAEAGLALGVVRFVDELDARG